MTKPSPSLHDTIKVVKVIIDTVRVPSRDSIDFLAKIDSFYNNSWSKLIVFITLAFAIIGIIIPLLIQWYQKTQLMLSEDRLKADIKLELKNALAELEQKFEKKNEAQIKRLKTETMALILHVEGLLMTTRKNYPAAIRDYFQAITYYLTAGSLNSIDNAFRGLKGALKASPLEDVDKAFEKLKQNIDKMIDSLHKLDSHDKYKTQIDEIKSLYQSKKNNNAEGTDTNKKEATKK